MSVGLFEVSLIQRPGQGWVFRRFCVLGRGLPLCDLQNGEFLLGTRYNNMNQRCQLKNLMTCNHKNNSK